VRVLITGCLKGWFTGKDLDDYIDGVDESDAEDAREFRESRRVVNGTDRADLIAKQALVFEDALTSPAAEPVKETPETEQVEPDVSTPEPKSNWLSALIQFILSLFKRG